MFYRILITAGMLAAMTLTVGNARAAGDAKLPDWAGAWGRPIVPGVSPSHDQNKPQGFGQEAPLTPEYAVVLQASPTSVFLETDPFIFNELCVFLVTIRRPSLCVASSNSCFLRETLGAAAAQRPNRSK
jgi:hypothetical protein